MADNNIQMVSEMLTDFVEDKVKGLIEKKEWMEKCTFTMVKSREQFTEVVDRLIAKGLCSLDLETTSLSTRILPSGESAARLVGVCLSESSYVGWYTPVGHEDKEFNISYDFVVRELARLVKNCRCIFHNFKYDGQVLHNHGIEITDDTMIEDTFLMAGVVDASVKERGLKSLAESRLNRPMIDINKLMVKSGKQKIVKFDMVPPQIALYYGVSDALNTFGIYELFKKELDAQDPDKKQGPWAVYERIEKRCLFPVMMMERSLCRIDVEHFKRTRERLVSKQEATLKAIFSLAGREFDVNSPKQLGVLLFEEMKIKYPEKEKTASGQYITDEGTLEKISDVPIVGLILDYRSLVKTIGTYIDNFLTNADEEGLVKFQLNQLQADTGRFSASGGKGLKIDGYCGVNCQNIPNSNEDDPEAPDIRKGIIARPGYKIVSIDYSGEELRIAANFSREPKWLEEFLHGTGDLHTMTARIIHNNPNLTDKNKKERKLGKCVAKGTLIATKRGWVPIEKVVVGDFVVTSTGSLKMVSSVHDMGVKPGKTITTKDGHRILCGYNHRFLTQSGEWVRAEDIRPGMNLQTMSCEHMNPKGNQRIHFNFWDKGNNNYVSESLPYIEANPLWGKQLGYLLGDGHIHPYYAGMCCSDKDRDVKEDIMETAKALGLPCRAKVGMRPGTKIPLWTINIGSTIFSRFCKEIGFRGRRGKVFRVPWWIFESTKEVQASFLRGLFETDGTVSEKASVSVCTKDFDLAQDIALLLASFGIRAHTVNKLSKKYNRMYYNVTIGRIGSELFREKIGFIGSRKRANLDAFLARDKKAVSQGEWASEVCSVEDCGPVELMDMTVEEDHTYVAQGLVSHNTINFLTMYGGGAGGFAAQAKISYEQAKRMIINFFRGYSGLKKWIDNEIRISRKRGFSKTAFGRRRPLAEFYNATDEKIKAKGDRCAVNSCIQGTGSDVIKIALYRVWKWLRDNGYNDDVHLLMPIHDEIVFEIKEDKLDFYIPELCEILKIHDLTDALGWPVPFDVDAEYGDSFHVDHNYWKERKAAKKAESQAATVPAVAPAVAPEQPALKAEPKLQESVPPSSQPKKEEVAVSVPQVMTTSVMLESPSVTTTPTPTSSSGEFIHFTVTVREAVMSAAEKAKAHLAEVESQTPDESLKDIHIKDRIDHRGVLIYPIERLDHITLHQFNTALSILVKYGDELFVGPKCRVSLVDKATGEVWYESSKKVSVDAFLALCFWLKI